MMISKVYFFSDFIINLQPGVILEEDAGLFSGHQISLWIKIAYTAFVLILIPIYWKEWGAAHFLWFSDIALLLSLPALWTESSLIFYTGPDQSLAWQKNTCATHCRT